MPARVDQQSLEVVVGATSTIARVDQQAIEVLVDAVTRVGVTQIALEFLVPMSNGGGQLQSLGVGS